MPSQQSPDAGISDSSQLNRQPFLKLYYSYKVLFFQFLFVLLRRPSGFQSSHLVINYPQYFNVHLKCTNGTMQRLYDFIILIITMSLEPFKCLRFPSTGPYPPASYPFSPSVNILAIPYPTCWGLWVFYPPIVIGSLLLAGQKEI